MMSERVRMSKMNKILPPKAYIYLFVANGWNFWVMQDFFEWPIPLKSWKCKILKDLQRRRICQIGTIRISGKPLVLNRCQGNFLLINNGSNSRISEQRSEQVWKFWPSPILVWKPQEFAGTSLSEPPLSLLCNTSFWFWGMWIIKIKILLPIITV